MSRVMAVAFERHGRLHYIDPGDGDYRVGEQVLVSTLEGGTEVAWCVWAPEESYDSFGELPRCAGPAAAADLARDEANRRQRDQLRVTANRLIRQQKLPMKVVGVDWIDQPEGATRKNERLAVVYFTAPGRVDFRALVGELARAVKARVDLRQIGSREAAQITGGIGSCGRDLCCATFAKSFEPISMRLAKDQDLPPNPMRVQGACGRLMCCLKYEHPLYEEFVREAPAKGDRVLTEDGAATVIGHSVPADAVVLRLSATGEVSECTRADACAARAAYEQRSDAPPRRKKARHRRENRAD